MFGRMASAENGFDPDTRVSINIHGNVAYALVTAYAFGRDPGDPWSSIDN